MLLFIGGAARTGKGILVRRLLTEMQMPYLSLDVLKMGLARGVPEFEIDPDAGGRSVGERLWPLVREMSMSLLRDGVPYAFEGELIPGHVAALRDAFPSRVVACFLGYATVGPAQKLADIRAYSDYPNNWCDEYTDGELLRIIEREIAFSRALMAECERYRLPYFDTSDNFLHTLDQVVATIRAAIPPEEKSAT